MGELDKVPLGGIEQLNLNVFSERYDAVCDALGRLPEAWADVVAMRHWGEMTFSEIGKVLGVTKQAAHQTYKRALTLLATDVTLRIQLGGDTHEDV